jgi:hypothetical protein
MVLERITMPKISQKGGDMVQSKQIEPGVLEIRLELHDLEMVLKKASLIDSEQAIKQVHIEPGELIIIVVQ